MKKTTAKKKACSFKETNCKKNRIQEKNNLKKTRKEGRFKA